MALASGVSAPARAEKDIAGEFERSARPGWAGRLYGPTEADVRRGGRAGNHGRAAAAHSMSPGGNRYSRWLRPNVTFGTVVFGARCCCLVAPSRTQCTDAVEVQTWQQEP